MNPASTLRPPGRSSFADSTADPSAVQRQRLETLGLLASGFAHDLNHLLTTIVTHAESAAALLAPQHPATAELALVRSAGQRASGLARRALQFGRGPLEARAPLNFVALVEETLPLLRAAIPRPIEFRPRFEIAAGFVVGEPNQLVQVLLNLALNAAQSITAGSGCIDLSVHRHPGGDAPAVDVGDLSTRPHLCLTLANTGTGLDAAARARLFSPFFTTKEAGHGTGLGLAIVRDIVLEFGGGIAVEAGPDEGTRFHVYLPEAPPLTTVAAPAVARAASPAHIVIIDDEDTVVSLAEQALQFAGYRASSLPSTRECVAQLARDPRAFDLIITDQRMPELSGLEMLRSLRASGQTVPVVITSGSLAALSLRELQAVTPARFLAKPFTLADLLAVVRELLEARQPATG